MDLLPDNEWYYQTVSKSARALADKGVSVQLGAHGELQGLGVHWELWMLAQGGMTPHQALHAATLAGARYLGMDQSIGTLEAGKLADLIVLDRNPLADIRNTDSVSQVMVNGRLYDAATMDQIGNHPERRQPIYWERGDHQAVANGPTRMLGCSCGKD